MWVVISRVVVVVLYNERCVVCISLGSRYICTHVCPNHAPHTTTENSTQHWPSWWWGGFPFKHHALFFILFIARATTPILGEKTPSDSRMRRSSGTCVSHRHPFGEGQVQPRRGMHKPRRDNLLPHMFQAEPQPPGGDRKHLVPQRDKHLYGRREARPKLFGI